MVDTKKYFCPEAQWSVVELSAVRDNRVAIIFMLTRSRRVEYSRSSGVGGVGEKCIDILPIDSLPSDMVSVSKRDEYMEE